MRDALRLLAMMGHSAACGFALNIALDPFASIVFAIAFALVALYHGVYALRNVVRFTLGR